jgi:hypothetical protein
MAYVPPHLRNKKQVKVEEPWLVQGKKQKDAKESKKVKVDEFPVLATPIVIQKSKMDFKELFTRRKELKKRQKKMKYGWIRLTKDGIIDSLTPEQREQSNTERNERYMEDAMIKLADRIDRDTERRILFEDLEPVILEDYSTEEEYESSEESYVDEDEEGYESK